MNEETLAGVRRIVYAKAGEVSDDAPLISGGLIDSMSIVDLILDVEQQLRVKIRIGEVQPDDFDSIVKIAATVERFT